MATPVLRGMCFDLDGLLVDSEPCYFEATRSVFAEHGVVLTKEHYARTWIIRGTKTEAEVPRMGIAADPAAVAGEVRRRFREMVVRDPKLMPGAGETLERASRRFVTALVTNTPRAEVDLLLDRLGIAPFLHHLLTRESYAAAKPAPDAYLAAVGRLGLPAADCLALEDSPRGVKAATAAGLTCIAVLNEFTRIEPPTGAARVLESLAELDLDAVGRAWPIS